MKYLAGMLKLWLDDEWSLQEPHAALGLAAATKCTEMRLDGCEEMGNLVMGVAQELFSFDFSDTFVNAFEVANKCSEILRCGKGTRCAASTMTIEPGRRGTTRWWRREKSEGHESFRFVVPVQSQRCRSRPATPPEACWYGLERHQSSLFRTRTIRHGARWGSSCAFHRED